MRKKLFFFPQLIGGGVVPFVFLWWGGGGTDILHSYLAPSKIDNFHVFIDKGGCFLGGQLTTTFKAGWETAFCKVHCTNI